MEKEILVSIVLPAQGSEAALDRCVRGVLAQSEARWQLLLVASTATLAWADAWARQDARIQVLRVEVSGRAAALRAGLAMCRGSFTVFLDAEHVWANHFLALTTAFLDSHRLEDMVCMEAHTAEGRSVVPTRPELYREQGRLATVLSGDVVVPANAVWRQGELARHLRWGEYTRLAVTLLRTDCAELLLPALFEESAALDYRLQARVAAKCAVNLIVCAGALHQPGPVTAEQQRQRETDALAVFDEIHRRQWETDRELARLRHERLTRIEQRSPLQALGAWCQAVLHRVPSPSRPMATDLGTRSVDHSL